MIHYWQLQENSLSYLEPYRTLPQVTIALHESLHWLRFPQALLQQSPSLISLPTLQRFHTFSHQPYLFSTESALPQGLPPSGPWEKLEGFLKLDTTIPSLPATPALLPPLPLTLQPVPPENPSLPASLLFIPTRTWITYAKSAPEYRLAPLQIACNSQGESFVTGSPLPPMAGVRFYEIDRIFLPLGFTWSPQISFNTLKQILNPQSTERIVWHHDNQLSRVIDEQWVAASRAGAAAMKADK